MTRTALYRHLNASGALLYVGIATDPGVRLSAHLSSSAWAAMIASMQMEWHENRAAALVAEASAILNERPSFNRSLSPKNAAARFVRELGIDAVCAALGVGASSVRNAMVSGVFPARWAVIVAKLCVQHRTTFPAKDFTWVGDRIDRGLCVTQLFDRTSAAKPQEAQA